MINGTLNFFNSEVMFTFDGNVLQLFLKKGEAKPFLYQEISKGVYSSCKKDLNEERFEGVEFSKNQRIIFYICKKGYGYQSDLDASNSIFLINVKKYILVSQTLSAEHARLELPSKQYHKFLGLIPICNANGNVFGSIAEYSLNPQFKDATSFVASKNVDCNIIISSTIRTTGSKFDFTPTICFEFSRALEELEFLSFYDNICKVLSLIFMRRNILPDDCIYISNGLKYEINTVVDANYVHENENIDSYVTSGFIYWGALRNSFQTIYDDVISNNVFFDFI